MDITNTNIVSIPNEKNKTKLLNLGKRHVPKKAKTNYIESTIESPVQNKKDTELFYFDYSGNKTREWHAEISGNKSSVLHVSSAKKNKRNPKAKRNDNIGHNNVSAIGFGNKPFFYNFSEEKRNEFSSTLPPKVSNIDKMLLPVSNSYRHRHETYNDNNNDPLLCGKRKKHSYDGLNGLRNKQLKKKKWKEPIKSENNCDPKYDCEDPTIREGLKKGTEESSILLNVMDSECDMTGYIVHKKKKNKKPIEFVESNCNDNNKSSISGDNHKKINNKDKSLLTDNCLSAEKKVDAEIEKREKLNIRKKCTKIDTIESIVKDESENLNKTKDACKYDIGIESCHKKKRKRNSRKVENQTTEAENLETSYLVNESLEKPADDSFANVIDLTLEKKKKKKRKNSNIFVLSDVKLDKSITTLQCGLKVKENCEGEQHTDNDTPDYLKKSDSVSKKKKMLAQSNEDVIEINDNVIVYNKHKKNSFNDDTANKYTLENQLTDDKENPNKAQDTSEYDTSIESCHKKKRKHNIRKVENQTTKAKNLETSYLVNQSLEKPADDSFVNVNDLTLEKKKNRKNSNLFVLSDVKLDKSITTLQCGVKVKENCEGEQHTDNDTPDYLKKSDSVSKKKKMLAHSNEDVIEINENVLVYNKHKKNSFNDNTANKYTLENQVSDDKEYLNKVQDTSEYDTSIESTYKKKKKRKKREAETQENRVDQSQNDKFRSYQIEEYIPSLVPNDLKIETGRTIIKHQSASENGASEIEIDDENTDNKKPRHVDCSMFNDYVNREKNTKNYIKSTPKTATNNKLSSDGTVCQNSDGVEYSSSEGYKSHSSDSELLSHSGKQRRKKKTAEHIDGDATVNSNEIKLQRENLHASVDISEKRSEPKKANKGGAETDENRLEVASGITSDNDSESNSSNGSKGCSDSEFLNETELDVLQLKEERYRFRHLQLVDVPFKVPILHLLTTTSTKPNAEQLTNIKNLNIEIKRGAYTKKEDNKIMENWKYFCREYGFQENPAIFIPIPRKTKMAVKLFFLRHLACGLDDRQLYRVYIRFKVLVQQPFIKTGRYSEEEDRTIVKFLSETNSYRPFCELGEKLRRDPFSILQRYKKLTSDQEIIHWTPELINKFVNSLKKYTKCKDVKELQHKQFEDKVWAKLSRKMHIAVKKLRRAWIFTIYPRLFVDEKVDLNQVKARTIQILMKRNETDWKTINWKEIAKKFPGFSHANICSMFKMLVHYYIPRKKRSDLKECLRILNEVLVKPNNFASPHKLIKVELVS